jgi:hypothetical protein
MFVCGMIARNLRLVQAMGVDVGFEISPPLTTAEDLARWDAFLNEVRQHYKHDPNIVENRYEIQLRLADYPALCLDGRYFRQLYANIALQIGGSQLPYFEYLQEAIHRHFGDRVHDFWDDEPPLYSYEELDEADAAMVRSADAAAGVSIDAKQGGAERRVRPCTLGRFDDSAGDM